MATNSSEPQNAIQSLDAKFYWLMNPFKLQAVEDYVANGKNNVMDMKTGDVFTTPDGPFPTQTFVSVKSNRTGRIGRVPINKLKGIMEPLVFDW